MEILSKNNILPQDFISQNYSNHSVLESWNSFFIEHIESLIANPFIYFQEVQLKKTPFKVKFTRLNRFIAKNYAGSYPDIQLYNFFAFLYSINYFKTMTEIKQWKGQPQEFFMNKSFNEIVKHKNGIVYLKSQLVKLIQQENKYQA